MFRDREHAGRLLAWKFRGRKLHHPLVLALPHGGVVLGAVLARALGAELDVALARRLRLPFEPERAVGAIAEDGRVYLNPAARDVIGLMPEQVEVERLRQVAEVARRGRLYRGVRPAASAAGRSVILADDGVASGSTLIGALRAVQEQRPREVLVAVPVGAPDALDEVRRWCDEVVCLLLPGSFRLLSDYYEDFPDIEDQAAVGWFRRAVESPDRAPRATASPRFGDRGAGGAPD